MCPPVGLHGRKCASVVSSVVLALNLCGTALGSDLNLTLIGAWEGGPVWDVALVGERAYVASGESGITVLDLSDHAQPRVVGDYWTNGFWAVRVRTQGGHAFVSAYEKGLWVFDIAAPGAPKPVGACEEIWAGNLALSDHHAFATSVAGLHVIDISSPTAPARVATVTNISANAVTVAKNHVFVGSRSWVAALDISDPSNPVLQGVVKFPREPHEITDLACVGDYLYVAGYYFGFWGVGYAEQLVVLDVSNPAEPRRVAALDFPPNHGGGTRLSFLDHYALVTVGSDGFVAVDVSDPLRPPFVGTCRDALPLAVRGSQLICRYDSPVFESGSALAVFEISPYLKSIAKEGANVKLDWEGFGPARLQRATRLTNPDWLDLPGFEGTNTATLPANGGAEFFRLVRP